MESLEAVPKNMHQRAGPDQGERQVFDDVAEMIGEEVRRRGTDER